MFKRIFPIVVISLLSTAGVLTAGSLFNKGETKAIEKDPKNFVAQLVPCIGSGEKPASSTQKNCDNIWNFWNAKANPSGISVAYLTHHSEPTITPTPTIEITPTPTTEVSPTPTPTPTPTQAPEQTLPRITNVEVLDCTSPSCGGISTLVITGTNFTPDTVVRLVETDFGTFYGENSTYVDVVNAVRVGGNGSTTIITDFYNLPCDRYMTSLYFPSLSDSASIATPIIPPYCN